MTKVVRLRSLSIQGVNTGSIGINYTSAKAVFVEDCLIQNFRGGSGFGISANLTADGGQLYVRDTIITNSLADGIRTQTSTGLFRLHVDNCKVNKNANGIHVMRNTGAVITNSDVSVNTTAGIHTEASTGTSSSQIDGCSINANATGIQTGPGTTSVRLANDLITINTVAGVNFAGTTTIFSYGDNRIRANTAQIVGGALNTTEGKQ
jgi:hypothetical protein